MPTTLRSAPIIGNATADWLDSVHSPPGKCPSFSSSPSTTAETPDDITRCAGHGHGSAAAIGRDVINSPEGVQGEGEEEEGGPRKSEGGGWEREIPFKEISSGVAG